MSFRTIPTLLLGGCLLVAEPPPGAEARLECEDTGCPGGFTCDVFYDTCAQACDDLTQPCQSGFSCESGVCVERCEEGSCPDHLSCRDDLACEARCYRNNDCVDGYICCTQAREDDGDCADVGACY